MYPQNGFTDITDTDGDIGFKCAMGTNQTIAHIMARIIKEVE